jgi:hypothetical protein
MLWAAARILHSIVADVNRWSAPMQKLNDLSRSLTALEPDGTLIAVIEMSLSSWLVAGIVPGVERQPLKKLAVDESALLKLLHRRRCAGRDEETGFEIEPRNRRRKASPPWQLLDKENPIQGPWCRFRREARARERRRHCSGG